MSAKINIAIDGPAGSGKGTTAKLLAQELEYKFLDTGAMYRGVAYYLVTHEVSFEDVTENHLENISLDFNENQELLLNDVVIEDMIRTPEIGEITPNFAALGVVRDFLGKLQKQIVEQKGYIAEGRDIGSVIMPEAELKIYLTASVEVRARRRLEDFKKKGILMTQGEVEKLIEERDHQDMTRDIAPLIKVDDAIEVDTSEIDIETQVEVIKKLALKHINYIK